jgi:EAL domain-containing protein (putative c-di-GMP-specific phosphodiesterase class I)
VECADILEELNDKIGSMEIQVGTNDETLKVEIYSGVSFNGKLPLEEAQIALREAKVKSLPYLAYAQNLENKVDTKNILDIKKTIKYAIEHKNIIPFFQPITNQYGEFIKYEALVRIIDFKGGKEKILYPEQFLSIAIRSGLYIDLAKEMLYQSLIFFKDRDEKISVNFLPNDFFNYEIMDRFIGLVQMYEKPERIVVEITEQEGVGDFDRLFKIVRKLRKVGVTIAIDDFGSGYANYVHILKLKPDYLKIDGSLIKNILTDEDSQILVKSITRFAGYMKIKTIAEYVESESIFNLLKKYGVDEFQGYYFGCPLNLISGPNIF